jgi:peptidoglycan/LPS O-acetylase OafA/YrhL
MEVYGLAFIAVFCGMLLVMALNGGVISAVMRAPFLTRMGKISYGFYIFHLLLGSFYVWIVIQVLGPKWNSNGGFALLFLVAAVGTYAISSLSFRYFESYFLKRK